MLGHIEPIREDYVAETWYSDAEKIIRKDYRQPDLFADLLAATSPWKQVTANWRLADRLWRAIGDAERLADTVANLMPAHAINVIRALQRKPLSGYKVSRFARNLKGDGDAVTVDVWICRAYGIADKLSEATYADIEADIQQARRKGMRPSDWQAVIWYAIRRLAGVRGRSFEQAYRAMRSETMLFSFMHA